MLGLSGGVDEIGTIKWQVALCLLLAWTLTFFALSKGVKSVGKVGCLVSLSLSAFPFVLLGYFYVCDHFSTPSFYHFFSRSPHILQHLQSVFEGAHFCRF